MLAQGKTRENKTRQGATKNRIEHEWGNAKVPFKRKCQTTCKEAKQQKARESKRAPIKAWVSKGNPEKAPESFARSLCSLASLAPSNNNTRWNPAKATKGQQRREKVGQDQERQGRARKCQEGPTKPSKVQKQRWKGPGASKGLPDLPKTLPKPSPNSPKTLPKPSQDPPQTVPKCLKNGNSILSRFFDP